MSVTAIPAQKSATRRACLEIENLEVHPCGWVQSPAARETGARGDVVSMIALRLASQKFTTRRGSLSILDLQLHACGWMRSMSVTGIPAQKSATRRACLEIEDLELHPCGWVQSAAVRETGARGDVVSMIALRLASQKSTTRRGSLSI